MTNTKLKSIFKNLITDITMLLVFLMLTAFVLWILWMYYLRGPVDIETRGYVSKTLKEAAVQPTDIEKYTLQHFHNLDDVVLKGIEYPSTCVTCHGDYPHNQTPKERAFFNAHSWFIACEVCHRENDSQENIIYKWLDSDTDIALYKFEGDPGNYAARIVPLRLENKTEIRLDNLIDNDTVSAYLLAEDKLSKTEQNEAIDKMHQPLSKNPVSCDQCHTENSLLEFKDLLYTDNMATYLKSFDIDSMIKGYEVFHLPKVLEPVND
jgi:hypothetical protein